MATRDGRTSHHPDDLFDAGQYGFAQAVSVHAGRLVFVSGQVAWDANEIEATAVVP